MRAWEQKINTFQEYSILENISLIQENHKLKSNLNNIHSSYYFFINLKYLIKMDIKKQNLNLLNEFLGIFEELPNSIINGLLKNTSDQDEINVIKSFSATFSNQFKELSVYIKENHIKLSKQRQADTERFLRISSGLTLVKDANTLSSNLNSPISRIGVSGIIAEIKKIILAIFSIFGISLPQWILDIVNLIDEILNDILSIGNSRLSNTLSKKEQNYLAELTQLAKLKKATDYMNNEDEEEE